VKMSEFLLDNSSRVWQPTEIIRLLLSDERKLFLSEYRAALDAARNVERYSELQEVLRRWTSIAARLGEPPNLPDVTPQHCTW
jgi:hypothetical protein